MGLEQQVEDEQDAPRDKIPSPVGEDNDAEHIGKNGVQESGDREGFNGGNSSGENQRKEASEQGSKQSDNSNHFFIFLSLGKLNFPNNIFSVDTGNTMKVFFINQFITD